MKTEIERIAKILNIKGSENLCLKIQDIIRNKNKELKKLRFMNYYYKEKFKMIDSRDNNMNKSDNTYKDNEIIRLKKLNADLNQSICGLKLELSKFHKERIQKIVKDSAKREELIFNKLIK
ncbi:hypothetical protein DVV91_10290 [Clostridium botulinum]|uniref:hypothetical protein n=1 Tax=Clostridium botulinum TaxID=1491 RepID=UPI0019674089|nr:hypothetical protein [Clostridium botulinum]MBN1074731.1 hypothetical protein [Clostridium botulinum]